MFHKITNIAQKYDYLVVVLFMLLVYLAIVLPFGYFKNQGVLLFSSNDAQSYRSVADWILGASDTVNPLIRPVLYPFLLVVTGAIKNNYGIWGFQVLCWLLSGVLLYQAVKSSTKNTLLSIAAVFIFAGNFTLLLLTLHALTEVTVVLLLSILITVVLNKPRLGDRVYWPLILFILSLLTITKPTFIPLWIALFIYRFVDLLLDLFKRKLDWKSPLYFVLASLPVIIQLLLMEINFHEFTISNIGSITLKTYFLARVYGLVNSLPLGQARQITAAWSALPIFDFVFGHFGVSLSTYITTILDNILSHSNFTNSPAPNLYLNVYMRLVNILYFTLHVVMVIPTIFVLVKLTKRRLWQDFERYISLILPLLLIFLSSGITFSQGDRIILPALPIWIVLYACVLSSYYNLRREKKRVAPKKADGFA
jgi:hypothetical protein